MSRFVISGATIHPIDQEPEERTVLVEDGKILELRQTSPSGWKRVEAPPGSHLIPGLVEAHCHVGLTELGGGRASSDGNETTLPLGAELRAVDGLHPGDHGFTLARRHGICTLCVIPGSSGPIGGDSVVVKARRCPDPEGMVLEPSGGLKLALGENPKTQGQASSRPPTTRMGTAAQLRQALLDARHYLEQKDQAAEKEEPFRTDLRQEALGRVLRRQIPARIHAHRTDDVSTALRLAREFDLELVVEHGTGGLALADRLVAGDVPVVFGPVLASGIKAETRDRDPADAVRMLRAGVRIALTTDSPVNPLSTLRIGAALMVREGLDEASALRMITLTPAEILGVTSRIGSLAPGKDADLVLLSGEPLDCRSRVLRTWIDGETVYRDGTEGDPP